MITQKICNLVDADVQFIAHQANCFHIMGGGVARAVREKYPEAYAADLKTKRGDAKKLGTFSKAKAADGKIIFNVYSQYDLAGNSGGRATDYEMVHQGLSAVESAIAGTSIFEDPDTSVTLGIPFNYGCALGGGSWKIIEAIIHDIFDKSAANVLICEWQPKNEIGALAAAIKGR